MGHIYLDPPKKYYLLKGLGAIFLGTAIGCYFSQNDVPENNAQPDQGPQTTNVLPAPIASSPPVRSHVESRVRGRSDPEACANLREADKYWAEAHNTGLTDVERFDAFGQFLVAELFVADSGMRVPPHSEKYLNDLAVNYALLAIKELTTQSNTQSNPVEKFLTVQKLESAFNLYFSLQDPAGYIVQIFGIQPSNPEYLKQMTGWSPSEVRKASREAKDSMIQDVALMIKSPEHAASFDSRPDAESKKIMLMKAMHWDLELTRAATEQGRESMGDLFRNQGVSLEQVGHFFNKIEVLRYERDLLKKKDNDALRLTPC